MATPTSAVANVSGEIAEGCYAARSRRLARAVTRVYDDSLRPLGIKASQQTVLVVIAEGYTRPVDIGAALDMEKSTVTRTLRLMENNGWVQVTTEGAGRSVTLTKEGGQLLVSSLEPWQAATREIASRLQAEGDLLPYLADPVATP